METDERAAKNISLYNPFLLPPAVIGANGENIHNSVAWDKFSVLPLDGCGEQKFSLIVKPIMFAYIDQRHLSCQCFQISMKAWKRDDTWWWVFVSLCAFLVCLNMSPIHHNYSYIKSQDEGCSKWVNLASNYGFYCNRRAHFEFPRLEPIRFAISKRFQFTTHAKTKKSHKRDGSYTPFVAVSNDIWWFMIVF